MENKIGETRADRDSSRRLFWKGYRYKRMAEPSHAFLLRCWQETKGDGERVWHFSLTYINDKREKKGFANLEAVVTYLKQILTEFDCNV